MRAIPGADPRRDQVQLSAVRAEPVQHGRDAAQGGGLLGAAAASAQRVQGHDGPGHLVAGHSDVAPQHAARLDRGPGHAGPAGRSDHFGPADAGFAGRTDGRPQHRAGPIGPADSAGTAERLRRGPDRAGDRPEPAAGSDTAAPAGAGGGTGPGRADARAGGGAGSQRRRAAGGS